MFHAHRRHEPSPKDRPSVIVSRSAPIAIVLHCQEKHGLAECHHGAGESEYRCRGAPGEMVEINVINADERLSCVEKGWGVMSEISVSLLDES